MTTRPRLAALIATAIVLLLALLTTPARSTSRPAHHPGAVGALAGGLDGAPSSPGVPTPPTPSPVQVADAQRVTPSTNGPSPDVSSPASGRVRSGWLAWAATGHGAAYLAVPEGPGHLVRLCGAGGCLTALSNDAGPDAAMRAAGRVGDLGIRLWLFVCGEPTGARGLCWATVEVWG